MDSIELIGTKGIFAVIEMQNVDDALPVGQALIDGGLPIIEITYRTDAASETIRRISKAFSQILVGAGSIVHISQAEDALASGAQFIVSAGFNPELVDWCIGRGVSVVPGIATASEITMGVLRNMKVLKFFPAEVMGGQNGLNALSAPFPGVKFIPMGGINTSNLAQYLSMPQVHACGGTWLASKTLIAKKDFDEIRRLTQEAMGIVKKVRGEL
jgi:2-dehydro-3-deoxyphosphogluconate aldolase/(4S)-4-hydroxy-2-oxoglutarate aldolase